MGQRTPLLQTDFLNEELVLSENSGYVTAFNMLVALPQDKIMDNVQTN